MEKIYKEIFDVLEKYQGLHVFDVEDMRRKSQFHLHEIKLRDVYKMNITPNSINSLDWNKLNNYISICWMGDKHKRTISWSVDGRQPIDEYMLIISFPTGAFIFGEEYPTEFFKQFFDELKSYSPKYIDDANSSLYFPIETCSDVFNNFNDILNKYYEWNKEEKKQRKILEMKKQLQQLENS